MAAATSSKAPIPTSQLETIARDACNSVLSLASAYDHTKAPEWNGSIVNKMLQSMATSAGTGTAASGQDAKPQYKYVVNSTVIQHLEAASETEDAGTGMETPGATPEPTGEAEAGGRSAVSASVEPDSGRRGMHSATGAYWNNETDGMWSYKWDGGEKHGMDVVVMDLLHEPCL